MRFKLTLIRMKQYPLHLGLRVSRKVIGVCTLFFMTHTFAAEVSPSGLLPGSAAPGPIGKAIHSEQQRTSQPTLSPTGPITAPQAVPGGEAVQKIKFYLHAIILEGSHVYSTAILSEIYKDKLNKTITVADLFGIAESITNYYRNNGYILTQAVLPPQHVKNGIVKIQIIEGFIGQVATSGTPKGARQQVLEFGEKIRQCPPLQIDRLQRYLLLANEIPATHVKAVLAPSPTIRGAAELTLETTNKPITGYFSYDNYGTRYIGPQQLTANIGLNSFFISGDSTQATVTKTAKGGELTYRDFNYNVPIDAYGNRWMIGNTFVHTHPLFVLQEVQIDGVNNNTYTSWFFPVIRTLSQTLTLQLNFNYLDSHVTILDTNLYTDHLRSVGVGGTYNLADSWYGSNYIYADLRQGLPVLGYTADTKVSAQTSRPGGRGDYTKIDFQASRLQGIKDWPLSLYVLIKAQYAFNPLLTYEQFAYGGSQLGRGYDVAEMLGDKALAGTAEIRYDLNINKILQTIEFYLFYDAGALWNNDPSTTIGIADKQSGMSTGVGARFYFSKYVSGNIMWTQVLTRPIAAEALIGRGKRPRVFFSIVAALPNA
jgi:hemolysin activation/secretion protein